MSPLMQQILANKEKARRQMANLPFPEKIAIVEKLRERNRTLAKNRFRSRQNPSSSKPFSG